LVAGALWILIDAPADWPQSGAIALLVSAGV
jgi:hypothetical protein